MSFKEVLERLFSEDNKQFVGFGTIGLVLVALAYVILKDSYKESKAKFCATLSVAIIAILLVCAAFYQVATLPPEPITCKVVGEIPIKSLNLGSQVDGSFFLGFGSVDNREYYYIYQQSGEGWLFRKLYADTWRLVEQDSKPELKEVECYQGPNMINRTLDIIVPKNTIVQKYTADVENLK